MPFVEGPEEIPKIFRAVQKPDETFRTSRLGLRPKHENRRREGCFAAETTQAWRGSTGEWTLSRRHAVFPSPSRPSPRLARVVSPFGPSPRRRTRNAPRHERSRKHASFRRQRHEAKSIRPGFVGKDELELDGTIRGRLAPHKPPRLCASARNIKTTCALNCRF